MYSRTQKLLDLSTKRNFCMQRDLHKNVIWSIAFNIKMHEYPKCLQRENKWTDKWWHIYTVKCNKENENE